MSRSQRGVRAAVQTGKHEEVLARPARLALAAMVMVAGFLLTYCFLFNDPPTAACTANPTSGDSPLAVDFDATSSSDPEGDPLQYVWDFGDGSTSTGILASHVFTSDTARVFTVLLTVTDRWGATDTVSVQVAISPTLRMPPPPPF